MQTVPDGKEEQRCHLTVYLRAQKSQSLVDVLRAPVIGVYIERHNVVIELRGALERSQLHVRATVPLDTARWILSVVRQTEGDAHLQYDQSIARFARVCVCVCSCANKSIYM